MLALLAAVVKIDFFMCVLLRRNDFGFKPKTHTVTAGSHSGLFGFCSLKRVKAPLESEVTGMSKAF